MMTEMMSRMTTRPHVIPMIVRLVLSSVSRMLAFLFSVSGQQPRLSRRKPKRKERKKRKKDVASANHQRTLAAILVPGVNTVLHAVADEGVVDAHVAVAEEGVSFTWS